MHPTHAPGSAKVRQVGPHAVGLGLCPHPLTVKHIQHTPEDVCRGQEHIRATLCQATVVCKRNTKVDRRTGTARVLHRQAGLG